MRGALPSTLALLLALSSAARGAPESCEECPGRVWFVDAGAKGAQPDGRSWQTAFRNLQSALGKAASGDCIWVAAGRYYTTSGTLRGTSFDIDRSLRLYGGFKGDERCLSQRAGLFKQTRLSGEIGAPGPADNAYSVITVVGPPPPGESFDVVIDGFTIRDANNDLGSGDGGGLRLLLADRVRIANCTVRDNLADLGAGLYAGGSGLDVVRTEFISNFARRDGGGLYSDSVESAADPSIGATLHNVRFKANQAARRGGAFYCGDMPAGREVLLVNALLHGNSADEGGAGYVPQAGSNGFLFGSIARLVNCTVADNAATTRGAAFAVEETGAFPGAVYLESSIVWNNTGALPAIDASPVGFSIVAHTLLQPGSPWACVPPAPCTTGPCHSFACDPLFGSPPYHPSAGSPAVDQGWPFGPPDTVDLDGDGDTAEPIPLDLDDQPRVVGLIDRGAYER